jgi:uncharacterized membrane protein YccF (DUF307 family)
MQKDKIWAILGNIALSIWSLISLVIFMYFPGAISHMQGATLYDFSTLPEKLSRISMAKYLLDTLVSLLGMVFFGASCVSLGMKLASFFHLDEVNKNDPQPLRIVLLPTYFLIGNAVFSLIFLTLASLSYLSMAHSIIILSIGLLSGLAQFRKLPARTTFSTPVLKSRGCAIRSNTRSNPFSILRTP